MLKELKNILNLKPRMYVDGNTNCHLTSGVLLIIFSVLMAHVGVLCNQPPCIVYIEFCCPQFLCCCQTSE